MNLFFYMALAPYDFDAGQLEGAGPENLFWGQMALAVTHAIPACPFQLPA